MIFSNRPTVFAGFARMLMLGIAGAAIGFIVAFQFDPLPMYVRLVPARYSLPKIPGGTALRLAMVHDILHERYLRHGSAWYEQRNRDAEKIIAAEVAHQTTQPSDRYLSALDDLSIGLQRTGHNDQAIATARKKLALVSPLPAAPATRSGPSDDIDRDDLDRILAAEHLTPRQHQQYTACANLGTILIHTYMRNAMTGDRDAKAYVLEGLDYIEKAIAINPGAHFGREAWQAIAVEDLLACIDQPTLLTQYDLIGDDISRWPGPTESGRPWTSDDPPPADGPGVTPEQRLAIRAGLPRVGGNIAGIAMNWVDAVNPDYTQAMPFDEPTLALIGMWTLGGGPNPHSALTLGWIMESIGQRQIAWNAYERAVEMKDAFWPDPAICNQMVQFCQKRQSIIAGEETTFDPNAWQAQMRHVHQAELAWGEAYQKAYQDYEAKKIAAGTPLDDPHFYDDFFRNRPPIASDPGLADTVGVADTRSTLYNTLPLAALCAGLAITLATIIPTRRARRYVV